MNVKFKKVTRLPKSGLMKMNTAQIAIIQSRKNAIMAFNRMYVYTLGTYW